MFVLLSPAKKQKTVLEWPPALCSKPMFTSAMAPLLATLKKYSDDEIAGLMNLSPKLAALNFERYQAFDLEHFDDSNSLPAMLTFDGDVYRHLDGASLSKSAMTFAQEHLLILSGLYGLLRPFDWMQPYRLEMKTPLSIEGYNSLADYWSKPIANYVNQTPDRPIINLASGEYSEALKGPIKAPVIQVVFKERRGSTLKVIGIMAKRARGAMARFIMEHGITDPNGIKTFEGGGYRFAPQHSSATTWTFINNAEG